jgi:transcriptional regulator with XRE-family HTH domain
VASVLGEKIRRLRKEKGMTLDGLAEASGSSKSYIWELENSNDPLRPSAEKLQKIADALGQTVEFLIDDEVNEEASADAAFYRKFRKLEPETKDRIREIMDVWSKAGKGTKG